MGGDEPVPPEAWVISVLVAAARPTARAGLAAVLRAVPGFAVVGEAAGAEDLRALAATLRPDVMLLELEQESEELAGAFWQLADNAADTAPVLLCDAGDQWAQAALRAGARGVLPRDATATEIAAAVTAAAADLLVLHPSVARALLPAEALAPHATLPIDLIEPLTPRELEVLRLLSDGLGNKGISRQLHISEHTVKFHVGAIMAKLGAASRTEAVTQAARRGLILL
jgi:DNA-binding NarL/FixJ family response regulator